MRDLCLVGLVLQRHGACRRGAAERQGRRQPEPERLYAVVQANSSCALETGVAIGSVHVVTDVRAGRGRAIERLCRCGGGGCCCGGRVRTDGWLTARILEIGGRETAVTRPNGSLGWARRAAGERLCGCAAMGMIQYGCNGDGDGNCEFGWQRLTRRRASKQAGGETGAEGASRLLLLCQTLDGVRCFALAWLSWRVCVCALLWAFALLIAYILQRQQQQQQQLRRQRCGKGSTRLILLLGRPLRARPSASRSGARSPLVSGGPPCDLTVRSTRTNVGRQAMAFGDAWPVFARWPE